MMNGYGMGSGSSGWIAMIVVWIALAALVGFVLMRVSGGRRGTSEPTAREILDHRLATGEIDAKKHGELADRLAHDAGR